jgi:hypothetical protein
MSYDILGFRNSSEVWRIPDYQAVKISSSGQILSREILIADGDLEALCLTRAMSDGMAVELWDGRRFIRHFPAVS